MRLAELLALPVVEWRERANFPTQHPLHQGFESAPLSSTADLMLALDHDVPYIPTRTRPAPDATIVQIDVDPIKERIPLWSFPVELPIRADTARALELVADVRGGAAGRRRPARASRRGAPSWRAAAHDAPLRTRRALADEDATPITPSGWATAWAAAREAPECVFVDETVTSNAAVWKHVAPTSAGTMFGSGGSAWAGGWARRWASSWRGPIGRWCSWSATARSSSASRSRRCGPAQMQQRAHPGGDLQQQLLQRDQAPLVATYPEGYSVQGRPLRRHRPAAGATLRLARRRSWAHTASAWRLRRKCCPRCGAAWSACGPASRSSWMCNSPTRRGVSHTPGARRRRVGDSAPDRTRTCPDPRLRAPGVCDTPLRVGV